MAEDIKKIEYEQDPERCEALTHGGTLPCNNKRYPGSKFCLCHGGNKVRDEQVKKDVALFQLTKYQSRIERLKSHNEARSLHNEIGILRMVLEERLNACKDDVDLLINSQAIGDLVLKIERVVTSMHKLEDRLGNYLSKGEILGFAQRVVGLLQASIKDETLLDVLANGILTLVGNVGQEQEQDTDEAS
jgi:hypothetical protein